MRILCSEMNQGHMVCHEMATSEVTPSLLHPKKTISRDFSYNICRLGPSAATLCEIGWPLRKPTAQPEL